MLTIAVRTLALALLLALASSGAAIDFNPGWRFLLGDPDAAAATDLPDDQWRSLDLPHDWAIELDFDPNLPSHTGKLPWQGVAWYRKHFDLPAASRPARLVFDFDGVMADCDVYLNGQRVGGWDYGYNSFRVDATDAARFGQPNTLAVRVSTLRHQSRWYPGAGIYRSVRMHLLPAVHVDHWGVWVRTENVTPDRADVRLEVTVRNHLDTPQPIRLSTDLLDPDGRTIATCRWSAPVPAGAAETFSEVVDVAAPRLWELDDPALYTAVTSVESDQPDLPHRLETTFGIRTFQWTADRGFLLNGRVRELRGVNLHHDQGPLGAALYPRALERQLQIMAEMGVNAIRTSHNVPDPLLLDLCDRMGLLVVNEVFDKWYEDIYQPYRPYARRQIENFVRRDRNHPCVILWSAGNEVSQQSSSEGGQLAAFLVECFHQLDPTRPVTIGANNVNGSVRHGFVDAVDVAGWNYDLKYLQVRDRFPDKPQFASESASTVSTRGYYDPDLPDSKTDFGTVPQVTSYDLCAPPWADLPDREFAAQQDHPWVAGEFVWTGFDYLGEPTPYGKLLIEKGQLTEQQASRSSYFGIVDLCGLPKDRFFLYRSHWRPDEPTVHLLPHWNWPGREGRAIPVFVYTSGDTAELFLNDQSLGRRAKDPNASDPLRRYRLIWPEVQYQPGTLKAVAYKNGQPLGDASVTTAGPVHHLQLTPDRPTIAADGYDLSYVTVEARDAQGNLCPLADNPLAFSVTSPAIIAAVGNGDPQCMDNLTDAAHPLFFGRAVVILRSQRNRTGPATLKVESPNLPPAQATIELTEPAATPTRP